MIEDELYYEAPNVGMIRMKPGEKDNFNGYNTLWVFRFQRNEEGKITGVVRDNKRYASLSNQMWRKVGD